MGTIVPDVLALLARYNHHTMKSAKLKLVPSQARHGTSSSVRSLPTATPHGGLPALPFYPDATLVRCAGGTGLALHWRDYRPTLNSTNEPLYWLNQLGALRLTRATVLPYVRFFLSQVRGTTGCFDLVEPDDPINWLPAINAGHKEQVRNHLQPMRYHGIDAGRHLVSATVIYSNYAIAALYRADIRIAPRAMQVPDAEAETPHAMCKGQLQICNEELLVDDLGIVIPQPPAC
ncbi:MAG: hypothetical protein KGM49_15825 [Sphingomonadales bacterium]|nr:hypothetical protein [Sphingomonadales bacterium]